MKANTMCSPASLLDTSSAKLKYNEHEVTYASEIFKKIKEFIAQRNHVASFELTDMYKKSVLSISFAEAYSLGWKNFNQEDLFEFRRREELSQYTVYVNLSSYDLTIAQNFKDLKLRYPSIFNEIGMIRTVPTGKNRYKVAVLIFNTQL